MVRRTGVGCDTEGRINGINRVDKIGSDEMAVSFGHCDPRSMACGAAADSREVHDPYFHGSVTRKTRAGDDRNFARCVVRFVRRERRLCRHRRSQQPRRATGQRSPHDTPISNSRHDGSLPNARHAPQIQSVERPDPWRPNIAAKTALPLVRSGCLFAVLIGAKSQPE